MGKERSTTWKKGQSGNPQGRPPLGTEDRIVVEEALAAVAVPTVPRADATHGTPGKPAIRADEKGVRDALWTLTPLAVLRVKADLTKGGDKAGIAARYVLDQTIGKATETIRHTGEGPGWEIRLSKLSDKLAAETNH